MPKLKTRDTDAHQDPVARVVLDALQKAQPRVLNRDGLQQGDLARRDDPERGDDQER